MLDHYTTPGESIEIRDNQTIYSLLTDRLARTGADTVIAAKKIGPGRWQNVTTGEFHERDQALGGRDHALVEFAGGDVLPAAGADFLGGDYRVRAGAGKA
ncbi:hypothetical protein, partial [Bifidobacterium longum]|uniref:hypothetical protein n=1 Tax=Bifidobacterium longum TaxID=216816 RepID=UPI0006AC233B